MTIAQVRVANINAVAGPATTTFYFLSVGTTELNALSTFYTAIKSYIPSTVTMQFPGAGNILDDSNGNLSSTWSATPPANVVGTATAAASSLSGVEVAWLATSIIDTHRPIGKTLIVPAGSSAYATNGTIAGAAATAIAAAANTLLSSAPGLSIWHRPKYDRTKTPPVLQRPGAPMAIASATVRPYPVVLRSRRS